MYFSIGMDSSVSSAPALPLSGANLPLTRGAGAGLGWAGALTSQVHHYIQGGLGIHGTSNVLLWDIIFPPFVCVSSILPIISLVSPV